VFRYAERTAVRFEVATDQARLKGIITRGNWGVRRKYIPCTVGFTGNRKANLPIAHHAFDAFERKECRVAFVHVTGSR